MSITFKELADFDRSVFHNIQGIHLDFDEFDDLTEDPKARAYAHRASFANSTLYRQDELQYHAIDFIFKQASWLPSRFGSGAYPVWYGSLDLETSVYETSYHWRRTFLEAPQGFNQPAAASIKTLRTVFTVNCQAALIDLRDKVEQHPELLDPDPLQYRPAQQIGNRIHREGYPGLITKSARLSMGENIAVFRKEILAAPAHESNYCYEYDLRSHKTVVTDSGKNKIRMIIEGAT